MIKPSDLRLGNLLWYDKGKDPNSARVVIVTGIEKKEVTVSDGNLTIVLFADELKGVPLTPEWLERFGFVWSDKYYRWRKRGERGQMFGLFRPDSGDGVWTFPKFTGELKYVHQVQNLYFALTGQELKTTE